MTDRAAEKTAMGYMPISSIQGRATTESRILPWIAVAIVGTGGVASGDYFRRMHESQMGYQAFAIVLDETEPKPARSVELMREIKSGFGRTMTRLPEVFGVSRQTLYNWLNGDTPKVAHQEKLEQLAEAARVFAERGFRPTSPALDRVILHGKSLLQLLSEGADGRETAEKLVRVVQRGAAARAQLEELMGGRKSPLQASDIGAPSLDEDA